MIKGFLILPLVVVVVSLKNRLQSELMALMVRSKIFYFLFFAVQYSYCLFGCRETSRKENYLSNDFQIRSLVNLWFFLPYENGRWVGMVGYLHFLRKTTFSAGKGQLLEAKIQYLKELNTSYPLHFPPITRSSPQRSSLRPAASILMWMFMATFAWTFFRYFF